MNQPLLVWDLPTRVFHWLFAFSFAACWYISESDLWLSVHIFFGYLMLSLIAFRLLWGFVGGHYARFSSFRYGPLTGWRYLCQALSGHGARHIGHNPAGSQAVYLLLTLGFAVGLTGILTQGGEEQHGALPGWLDMAQGIGAKIQHGIFAYVMLLAVIGHLVGVALESWLHRENLARAMLTGIKQAPSGSTATKPFRGVAIMLLLATAGSGVVWFAYAWQHPLAKHLGYDESEPEPAVAFAGPKLPDNPTWRKECGDCHLAFHPNLLPARSWQRLVDEQHQHFGTDLELDDETKAVVLEFLLNNAAEHSDREAAYKISHSIKAGETPIRITDTLYWYLKHHDISDEVWHSAKVKAKSNCPACHLDAEAGTFEDAAMEMPK